MAPDPDALAGRLLDLLAAPGYRPLKQHELAKALHLKTPERAAFRALLYRLERDGRLACLRKNRWALPQASRALTGKLAVHTSGFGFVTPEVPDTADIFIEKEHLGVAQHGDRVQVELSRPGRKRGAAPPTRDGRARLEGRVTRVVERARSQLVGTLRKARYYWYVIPDNPRLHHDVRVREFGPAVGKPADLRKVVVQLDPWEDPHRYPEGVVVEDLGQPEQPGVDVLGVMRDHGLVQEFDEELVRSAARVPAELKHDDLAGRRDVRELVTITIDPEDARDFDDAISLTRGVRGHWNVWIHIADVSHFVRPGNDVDAEALRRGNSVYMVDRFIPMLPQYLTSDVCSLRPNLDRLTHTVCVQLDDDGRRIGFETFPSVIHSVARLNYDQVQKLLEGRPDHAIPAALEPLLRDMDGLARRLRALRLRNGAIDLSMPEVRCQLDERGIPLSIYKRGAHQAYHLIEEFMLLANTAVAEVMSRKGVPALYRIHEPPSDEQWGQMAVDLANLGFHVEPANRRDINRVAREVAGTPFEYTANLAILKNLKRALYSTELVEHFGLAFDKYTHFTSPIRRYPDLVVHRILKAIERHERPPYSHEQVAHMALHCSATERNADEAEDESLAVKRVEFYALRLERRDTGPFPALIVSFLPRGMVVEVIETLQRGLVHFSTMTDDHYTVDETRSSARGRRRKRRFHIGQAVQVELVRVDTSRRLVDFRLSQGEEQEAYARRGRKQRVRV